jgi:4-deoxy-L-threo-5-hexosulose-uronate ketol-isomerase
MVSPYTISSLRPGKARSAKARRHTLHAVIPGSRKLRQVEAFDASPAINQVQAITTADNSSLQFIRFSRILLDISVKNYGPIERTLAKEEAVFYVNHGHALLTIGGQTYSLSKGDVLYVGIEQTVRLETDGLADISEFRAIECHTLYPVQLVHHTDIEGTPLAADLGSKRPMSQRTVFKLVDKNVQANRLLFGDTYLAHAGAVGSYPPHFHGPDGPHGLGANAKEEVYHFRCASDIAGDVPYVLQNCALPEEKVNTYVHVFDDVAINVTPTYHDTIAPPAVRFMFTWCLASFTEGHRDWAEIFNKPGYEAEW